MFGPLRLRCVLYCLIVATTLSLAIVILNSFYWATESFSGKQLVGNVNRLKLTYRNENISTSTTTSTQDQMVSFDSLLANGDRFRQGSGDIIVFLHIQKCGGSFFGESIALFLDVLQPCECNENFTEKCQCSLSSGVDKTWLFSWHSFGWTCGLHPAWTWLTRCVPNRLSAMEGAARQSKRYFYVTILRNPIHRYLSEYNHKKTRGGWGVVNFCEGRIATTAEVEPCFIHTTNNFTLDEFLACSSNQANNRQTMMLADLQLAHCYNHSSMTEAEREKILLSSAKANLRKMAFFGINEMQTISQLVFERTFQIEFTDNFTQFNHTRASLLLQNVTLAQLEKIQIANRLDLQLYSYAISLLRQRTKQLGII